MKKIYEEFKEIDNSTVIVGDFNTPLSTMDRSFKQKITKNIAELNNTLDHMGLTDWCVCVCIYMCVCVCVYI